MHFPAKMLLAMAVMLLLSTCGRMPVYSHFENVDADSWQHTDTLRFTIPVDQADAYRLYLHLRTTNDYPYTQLALTVECKTASPDRERLEESIVIDVADNCGNNLGQGLSMHQYTTALPFIVAATQGDTIFVAVSHAMSRKLMPGIADVGITAEIAEE